MASGAQLKKIAFLAPRPGMAMADFYHYWRTIHGPTVAHSPGYGTYRRRYAQNHPLADGPVGGRFGHAGIAIFHLPGDANEDEFSASAIYQNRIQPDERNFIDMQRTVSMAAAERVLLSGTGPAKLIILNRCRPDLDRAIFDARMLAICTDAARNAAGFSDRLRGWTLNYVITDSFRLPGAAPADACAVDCMQELWFAGEQDLAAAFASAAYRDRIGPDLAGVMDIDNTQSFRAEEIVFFDDGAPTTPPPG